MKVTTGGKSLQCGMFYTAIYSAKTQTSVFMASAPALCYLNNTPEQEQPLRVPHHRTPRGDREDQHLPPLKESRHILELHTFRIYLAISSTSHSGVLPGILGKRPETMLSLQCKGCVLPE